MTQIDDQAGTPAGAEQAEGLEVRIARQLLDQAKTEGVSLVGPGGLLAGVTKAVLQSALDAEMADHLGYARGERPAFPAGNHRNGSSPKTVLTEVGPIPLEVPRDRNGKFEPQIVPKHARRVEGFSEAIVSLYAKGLTMPHVPLPRRPRVRDLQGGAAGAGDMLDGGGRSHGAAETSHRERRCRGNDKTSSNPAHDLSSDAACRAPGGSTQLLPDRREALQPPVSRLATSHTRSNLSKMPGQRC